MNALAIVLAAAVAVIVAIVGPPLLRQRRRSRLLQSAMAEPDRSLLHATRAHQRLPLALQPALEARVRVFLAEQAFIGCAGLSVTRAMRLEIASQACLLLLGRDRRVYDQLRSILVYPDGFLVPRSDYADGVVTEYELPVSGESRGTANVILAWRDVAAANPRCSPVIHEFAHYLDHEEGATGGSWTRGGRRGAARWARVMGCAFAKLQREVEAGRETLLEEDALENETEFFAFATEAFFESARELAADDPELYAELARYYRLDPAAW